jgi:serine/threonine-protein kinase RsbW
VGQAARRGGASRGRQARRDRPPCGQAGARAARLIIAQCLAGLVTPEVLGNTQLLATELVTNSVRHGELADGDTAIVRVYLADEAVRVDVENPGTAGVVAPNGSDPRIGRGFGLELVGDLAVRWGIRRDRNTHVWFEIERQA